MRRYERFILIEPGYDSKITELVLYLERFRVNNPIAFVKRLVHPEIFSYLRSILHAVECVASARIEGNRTTLEEYVLEIFDKTRGNGSKEERIREVLNINKAVSFVEELFSYDTRRVIDRSLISEVHKIISDGLVKEGSKRPGEYRNSNVWIKGANFVPPDFTQVPDYMEEWIEVVNRPIKEQYHLIRLALAHHRLVWIHPFDNGNGRVARVLMYAMLLRDGFNIEVGRLISPSGIFYNNRQLYYDMLSRADTGRKEDLILWVEYVLSGIKHHAERVISLMDAIFLEKEVFRPMLDRMMKSGLLTKLEFVVLSVASRGDLFRNADIRRSVGSRVSSTVVSRAISSCVNKGYLKVIGRRRYLLNLANLTVARLLVSILREKGFIEGDYD